LIFVTDRIRGVLRDLISNADSPPIILLLGDHGPRSGMIWRKISRTDQRESFRILTAFYLPGKDHSALYPEISPVNAFRLIFNLYFGTSYEMLSDRSLASTDDRPYRFRDVTARVRGEGRVRARRRKPN
jgi:hypothetical protein